MSEQFEITYVARFIVAANDEDCANEVADAALIDLLERADLDLEDVFDIKTEISKVFLLDDDQGDDVDHEDVVEDEDDEVDEEDDL